MENTTIALAIMALISCIQYYSSNYAIESLGSLYFVLTLVLAPMCSYHITSSSRNWLALEMQIRNSYKSTIHDNNNEHRKREDALKKELTLLSTTTTHAKFIEKSTLEKKALTSSHKELSAANSYLQKELQEARAAAYDGTTLRTTNKPKELSTEMVSAELSADLAKAKAELSGERAAKQQTDQRIATLEEEVTSQQKLLKLAKAENDKLSTAQDATILHQQVAVAQSERSAAEMQLAQHKLSLDAKQNEFLAALIAAQTERAAKEQAERIVADMKAQFHQEVQMRVAAQVGEIAQAYRLEAEGYVLSVEKNYQLKLEEMAAAQAEERKQQQQQQQQQQKQQEETAELEELKELDATADDDDDEFEEVDADAIARAIMHGDNTNIGYTFGTTGSGNAGFDFKAPEKGT